MKKMPPDVAPGKKGSAEKDDAKGKMPFMFAKKKAKKTCSAGAKKGKRYV